jgi:hypothetical protein
VDVQRAPVVFLHRLPPRNGVFADAATGVRLPAQPISLMVRAACSQLFGRFAEPVRPLAYRLDPLEMGTPRQGAHRQALLSTRPFCSGENCPTSLILGRNANLPAGEPFLFANRLRTHVRVSASVA